MTYLQHGNERMLTIPDPLIPPLRDSDQLVGILAEVTGASRAVVYQQLLCEEKQPGSRIAGEMKAAQIPPHLWSDELLQFYSSTEGFLYESTAWNRHPEKLRIRKWIVRYLNAFGDRPMRILCYGDGLGFDSLYFNLAGHQADYFDVSTPNRNFAAHIYKRNQQTFRSFVTADQIPEREYDAIVCLDVLEHVPDPPAMVQEFTRYLKKNGRLVVNAPFFLVSRWLPTHLASNRKYSGSFRRLYKRFGFQLHEGCLFWNPVVLGFPDSDRRLGLTGLFYAGLVRYGGMILWGGRWWSGPYGWSWHLWNRMIGSRWSTQMESRKPIVDWQVGFRS